jgi:hypothetical protein
MFSQSLRKALNRRYQDESLTTMERQMIRLTRLLKVGNVSLTWDLVKDAKRVQAAVEAGVTSLSSQAGIYNTLVQVLPHLWEDDAEGLRVLGEYEELFRASKTGHFEGRAAEEEGEGAAAGGGGGAGASGLEVLKRRWKLMMADGAAAFTPEEVRVVALYALLPPMIPSVYERMRVVDSKGVAEVMKKMGKVLAKGGYNMYDLGTGVMMITHQREEPYVVQFKVGRELRELMKRGEGRQGKMVSGGVREIMRRLFPESHLSPRILRAAYWEEVWPGLDKRQQEQVAKWANFTTHKKLT